MPHARCLRSPGNVPILGIALGLGGWALWRASNHGTHGRGRAIFAMVVGLLATLALLVWQMS